MLSFRLYDKELDFDLEEWSTKEYSEYYNDVSDYYGRTGIPCLLGDS